MANTEIVKTIDQLRKKIENLNNEGAKIHAKWLEKVLEIGESNIARENKIISPKDYLDKANYTDILEREYGPPIKSLRFCVTSDDEYQKCRTLSKAAFSRNIRPRFDCVRENSVEDCMKTIRDNGADIITLDGGLVDKARSQYNLKPIVAEKYGETGGTYYAVAVVKKNSPYRSFSDLRGAKSCHTGIGRTAGYNAPLYTLIKLGLIQRDQCPYAKALSEFFSGGSCLPGARDMKNNLSEDISDRLCSLCAGNKDVNDESTKCNFDATEAYSGYTGAFRCLVEGEGDVAFVKHVTVRGNTGKNSLDLIKVLNKNSCFTLDGRNPEGWASHLKSSDFELLCPDGVRNSIDDYENCHLARAPPHMVYLNLK